MYPSFHYHGCWQHGDERNQVSSSYYNVIASHNVTESALLGLYGSEVMSTRRIGGIIDLSLQWRQSERHSVPNLWRLVCLLNRVFQALIKENTSLAFVRAIYRWLVDSPHKGPVIRKMFPFCYIIMPEISGISRTMPLLVVSCRARTQDICNPGVDYTGKMRACLPWVMCSSSVAIAMSWNGTKCNYSIVSPSDMTSTTLRISVWII